MYKSCHTSNDETTCWDVLLIFHLLLGYAGNAGQANYVAAKAGVIGLTKTTAKELAARNINVNAIAPGFITTEMTDELPEEVKEAMLTQIPLAKLGQPEDVAKAVVFLASDDSNYITGQTLHIDGGMVCNSQSLVLSDELCIFCIIIEGR